MSNSINIAHVQKFRDDVVMLSQQRGSKLRSFIMEQSCTGKYDHFDRLGSTSVRKVTSRHADTPLMNTPHSRRRVILDTYDWADLIDRRDKVRNIIEFASSYQLSAAWAFGRQIDEIIYDAAVGNAAAIDSDDASSNVALSSGQKIDKDFGTGSDTNLTLEKLREAKRILMANNVDLNDPMNKPVIAVNASAHDALLAETQVVSIDYNDKPVLVEGLITRFMGFDFVHYESIKTSADAATAKSVIAFCKSAIGLSVGEDVFFKASERDDKRYSHQIYGEMDLGAVRVEEEKVVKIDCVQS